MGDSLAIYQVEHQPLSRSGIMAFRDLVDGDCTGPSSLIRLTSHLTQDHGFQEEGIQRQHAFPGSHDAAIADQFVEQFLEETGNAPLQTFKMDSILREMQKIDYRPQPDVVAQGKLEEFNGNDTAWASQYLASGRHFDENQTDAIWDPPLVAAANHHARIAQAQNSNELGLNPLWADEYLEHSISLEEQVGMGEVAKSGKELAQTKDQILDSSDIENSKLMKLMHQKSDNSKLETPQNVFPELDGKWTEEYMHCEYSAGRSAENANVTDRSVLSKAGEDFGTAEAWAEELKQENAIGTDSDKCESMFWARLQGEWNKISTLNNLVDSHPWLPEYEKYYDPFNEYKFSSENPMRDINNALEEGKRRLEAGDLPSAVLCFEAAVQQDAENAEAWLMLGKTQAENEQDPLAISALKNCLNIEPSNEVALMTLAVAYTNESYQNQACLTLKEWLLKNEKYSHLSSVPGAQKKKSNSAVSTILFNDVHEEVKDLYIKAARMNPRDGIDPDVQSGLGVLFNLSCEYDKAADCFQAALSLRSDDSRLWNRYGATLANGQRSEEAVKAYHRALELSPGFIRARYNLGIACINLGAYKEAAEHLLTALNQQSAGRGVQGDKMPPGAMSDTIWSTLRLVLSLMHKHYLLDAVESRDLKTINREFEI